MPGEDEIDVPDAWRQVVHPRRRGMIGLEPAIARGGNLAKHPARAVGGVAELDAEHERVLGHPGTDPALAALGRSGEPSVAADAVRLALAPIPTRARPSWSWSVEPIEDLVTGRGLARAVAAFVTSCGYEFEFFAGIPTPALVRRSKTEDTGGSYARGLWDGAARHLRCLLAAAPQEVYDEAIAALAMLRGGLLCQRIAASYLVPDSHDWVSTDLADLPAGYRGPRDLLFSARQRPSSWPASRPASRPAGSSTSSPPTTRSAMRWLR